MEYEEIIPILIFVGGGAICGAVVAVVFRRHQHPFSQTAIWSAIVVPLVALSFVAISVMVATIWRFGFNPLSVIGAVLSSVFFLIIPLPVVCGVPAVITGLAMQCGIQAMCNPKE